MVMTSMANKMADKVKKNPEQRTIIIGLLQAGWEIDTDTPFSLSVDMKIKGDLNGGHSVRISPDGNLTMRDSNEKSRK